MSNVRWTAARGILLELFDSSELRLAEFLLKQPSSKIGSSCSCALPSTRRVFLPRWVTYHQPSWERNQGLLGLGMKTPSEFGARV